MANHSKQNTLSLTIIVIEYSSKKPLNNMLKENEIANFKIL